MVARAPGRTWRPRLQGEKPILAADLLQVPHLGLVGRPEIGWPGRFLRSEEDLQRSMTAKSGADSLFEDGKRQFLNELRYDLRKHHHPAAYHLPDPDHLLADSRPMKRLQHPLVTRQEQAVRILYECRQKVGLAFIDPVEVEHAQQLERRGLRQEGASVRQGESIRHGRTAASGSRPRTTSRSASSRCAAGNNSRGKSPGRPTRVPGS